MKVGRVVIIELVITICKEEEKIRNKTVRNNAGRKCKITERASKKSTREFHRLGKHESEHKSKLYLGKRKV